MIAVFKRAGLSLLFLVVAVLLFAMSFDLNPTARLVPVVVAVPTVALLVLQVCLDFFPKLSRAVARFERLRLRDVEALRARGAAPRAQDEDDGSLGPVLMWFGAAPVLIYLLGFTLAVPLYTAAFIRFRARESWIRSLAMGAAVALLISLLLGLAVGSPGVDGVLTGWALNL